MKMLLVILAGLLTVGMKTPPGCIAAKDAKPAAHDYADRVIHERTGIEMTLIPAGTFTMGTDEANAASNPKPARQVLIRRPFYMGETEVTNAQYRRFVKANPDYKGEADVDPNYDLYLLHFRGKSVMSAADDYPVVYVSWHNANAFCAWAGLTLPGEAQWEYACRAGTTTKFSFGDDLADIPKYAWVDLAAGHRTHPVATKLPNPWGLYDLHGNVWEWCADDYIYQYINAPFDETIRRDPQSQTKPLRGGSWSTGPCRSLERTASWWHTAALGSVARFNVAPGNAWQDRGFRVILPLTDVPPIEPPQAAAKAAPVDALIAHYTFEDGDGDQVLDSSGRENHGRNQGASRIKLDADMGFALRFDSLAASVDCGDRPDFDLRADLTLELWVKPETMPANGEIAIVGKGFNSFLLSFTSQLWAYINSGSNHLGAPITQNRWHHIVSTYDRQTMRLYVDGEQVAEKPWTYPVPKGDRFYLRPPLAGDDKIEGPWSFLLDDVRVYAAALPAAAVAKRYRESSRRRDM